MCCILPKGVNNSFFSFSNCACELMITDNFFGTLWIKCLKPFNLLYDLADPAILHKEIKEKNINMANIANYTTEELKELASICEIPVFKKSKVWYKPYSKMVSILLFFSVNVNWPLLPPFRLRILLNSADAVETKSAN